MSSAICSSLDQSKILSSGNGLNEILKYHVNDKRLKLFSLAQDHLALECLHVCCSIC